MVNLKINSEFIEFVSKGFVSPLFDFSDNCLWSKLEMSECSFLENDGSALGKNPDEMRALIIKLRNTEGIDKEFDLLNEVTLENLEVEGNNFFGGECYITILGKSVEMRGGRFEENGLGGDEYPSEDEERMETSSENESSLLFISRSFTDQHLSILVSDITCSRNRAIVSSCIWIDLGSSATTTNSLTIQNSKFEQNIADNASLLYCVDPSFSLIITNCISTHNLNKGFFILKK